MEIKINEILLIVTLLVAILSYFSSYSKILIKEYGVLEVNRITQKTFNLTMIANYLIWFLIATIVGIICLEIFNIRLDFENKYLRYIFGAILFFILILPFIYQIILHKKMIKRMVHISNKNSVYHGNKKKYLKFMNVAYSLLIIMGLVHGFIFSLFSYSNIDLVIWNVLFGVIPALIILLSGVGAIQAYALTYGFTQYKFVINKGENFEGYLISENDNYFIIKINWGTVIHIKKDTIDSYELTYNS